MPPIHPSEESDRLPAAVTRRLTREFIWLGACAMLGSLIVAAVGVSDFSGPAEAVTWITIGLYVSAQAVRLFVHLMRFQR